MKKFLMSILATFMLFTIAPTRVFAEENSQKNEAYCPIDSSEDYPVVNKKYNEAGEVVEFSVLLGEENHEKFLSMNQMRAASHVGSVKFVGGLCFAIEVVFDISCAKVAREIGLKLVEGFYMMANRKYTGTWEVTYGYIQGCEPRHSLSCFAATYKKIG